MAFYSDGPDKLKNKYACYLHHSGVRTFDSYRSPSGRAMLTDFDCCCDPCNHTKATLEVLNDPSEGGSGSYCCSCSPNTIVAKWVGDNGNPCTTKNTFEAMGLTISPPTDGDPNRNYPVGVYNGTLMGRNLEIYLSSMEIDQGGTQSEPDGSGCRWTIWVSGPGGGAGTKSVTFIDHVDVTCLSVPSVQFASVSGHSGLGTISFDDYYASKVPFRRRSDETPIPAISTIEGSYFGINGSQTFTPAQTGMSIELPAGRISPPYIIPGIDSPLIGPTGGVWSEGCNPTGIVYPTMRTDSNPTAFYATGRPINLCNEVPRFLCVNTHSLDSHVNGVQNRDFTFDTGYFPRHRMEYHPAYTGIEYFTTGTALCRWEHIPLDYELSKEGNPTAAWHNPDQDKHKKYIYLYETFIDNVLEFSGDMAKVYESGVPKRILLPALELDPLEDDDQNSQAGQGVAGEYVSPDHAMNAIAFNPSGLPTWGSTPTYQNGIGPAYHGHVAIDGHNTAFKAQNEIYYWNSGLSTVENYRTPWLGGIEHGSSFKLGEGSGKCSCDLSAYATYPFGVITKDTLNIHPGKCGCWSYYCSNECRCVPKKLCYSSFEFYAGGGYNYSEGSLTWNPSSKGWESGESGIDLLLRRSNFGFQTGNGKESYTPACVTPSFASESGYYVDKGFAPSEDSDVETVITCDSNDMSFSFSSNISDDLGVAQTGLRVTVLPSYGDCDLMKEGCCASPCESGCNGHPDSINLNLYGYSVEGEDECGEGGLDCSYTVGPIDITLNLVKSYTYIEGSPPFLEPECYYLGTYTCGSRIYKVTWQGDCESCGLSATSFSGVNEIILGHDAPQLYSACANSWYVDPDEDQPLVQSCEPYYAAGTHRSGGSQIDVWFNCGDGDITRFDMEITEL